MSVRSKGEAAVDWQADSSEEGSRNRAIGDIIRDSRRLNAKQVEQILAYQRQHRVRFGEAAVALKMATEEDIVAALAQQFQYPLATQAQRVRSPELITINQPFSKEAEAFRAIRSQLMNRVFSGAEQSRALAVVSPDSKDGKSYFAANLSVVLAQLGGRTLLVDADMRFPRQHKIFDLEDRAGLSTILSGRNSPRVIQEVAGLPSLFVLPVGVTPPNPLELLERPAFGIVLQELSVKFDYVVVDTPSAEHGSDATVIASRCGSAVLLARQNESRVTALQDLVGSLNTASAKIAGVVFNVY